MKNRYLIGLTITVIIGTIVSVLNLKEYSFFGMVNVASCPYGGITGQPFRHICPEDGGDIMWFGVVIFIAFLVVAYSVIYGVALRFKSKK